MIQIRRNVFETNSSSTHSITMCMQDEYDRWVKGEVFLNCCYSDTSSEFKDNIFLTKEQILDYFEKGSHLSKIYEQIKAIDDDQEFKEFVAEWEFYTYDNYRDSYLESFQKKFTTPSGETVIAFGQYGYDG